ncbi:MAG TPA: hypothetical protein VMM18_10985 [Gemmatimonadaceae bacterium]|nr:hypothetical protein [Gemmatimonadaceae bacterium]
MRTRHFCSILFAAGILTACEDSTTISEPSPADPALAVSRAVEGITAGGGKAQLPPGFTLLRFAFNAKLHADGSATGRFQQLYESSGGTVDFHGVVTCVSFDAVNGRAWVGGVITQNNSTNAAVQGAIHQVGRDVWFRVVDNGEGESAADRTTVFGFEGAAGFITSAAYCAGQPWAANDANTWAVVEGNLQVKP